LLALHFISCCVGLFSNLISKTFFGDSGMPIKKCKSSWEGLKTLSAFAYMLSYVKV